MLFAPGPLPSLTPDVSSLQPEQAQFEPLINSTLAELPQVDDDLGALVESLGALELPGELDDIDPALDTADGGLNELEGFVTSLYVANADSAVSLAQGNLLLVAGESPAEIWSPIPDAQSGPGGGPSHPGENGPTQMSIANLTRPGDQTFFSGDQFQIIVQINTGSGNFDFANKPLSLTRSLNGEQQPELPIGSTDQFGRLVYTSVFDPSSVGERVFGLDPPGYGTFPQLLVTVQPSEPVGVGPPPPPPPPPPAPGPSLNATLENVTTGDGTLFHVSDVYQQTIYGPLAQPVYMRQVKNGIDQGEILVGYTDQNGRLQWVGTISDQSVADYSESFRVGASAVPVQLHFSVVP
jgi:hypothetical protein